MSTFKAVFFDFGGTLFSYRSWGRGSVGIVAEAAERLGVEADRRERARAYRESNRTAFRRFADRSYFRHRDLFSEIFRRYAQELGAEASEEWIDWFYEAQRAIAIEELELRPDCRDTLAALRDEGLYLSIVSNIDDDYLHPMVQKAELDRVLDHWSSSEEAQSCKPDSGLFRMALDKAGCEAGDVLFVGDSPEHDVAGARPLGMTTALIVEDEVEPPGSGAEPTTEPHHVIRSLSELLPIVRGAAA